MPRGRGASWSVLPVRIASPQPASCAINTIDLSDLLPGRLRDGVISTPTGIPVAVTRTRPDRARFVCRRHGRVGHIYPAGFDGDNHDHPWMNRPATPPPIRANAPEARILRLRIA